MKKDQMTYDIQRILRDCQHQMAYKFQKPELLLMALTHTSYAVTHVQSNERLEFLGDSVLGLVISDLLYRHFPQDDEGKLTMLKGVIVSRKACCYLMRKMNFESYFLVGKGVKSISDSMLANLMEAIIGAIYLDSGFEAASDFIERTFEEILITEADLEIDAVNYKTKLQNYVHEHAANEEIEYHVLDEQGPLHHRCFKIAVRIGFFLYPGAWGPNKKTAEQRAAENAICVIQKKAPPHLIDD